MKKIMTFAAVALLLGGLTLTANAQKPTGKPVDPNTTTTTIKDKDAKNDAQADTKTTKADLKTKNDAKSGSRTATNAKNETAPKPAVKTTKAEAKADPKAEGKDTPKSSVKMSKAEATTNAKAEAKTAGKEVSTSKNKTAGKAKSIATSSKAEATANAKAQGKTAGKEKAEVNKAGNDTEKQLKAFESKVNECVSLFKKIEKDGGSKSLTQEFEKCLSQAEDMKTKLEASKDQMDRTQTDRLGKAITELSQVYIKK